MLSRSMAISWMSSRSKGVMKVWFRASNTSRVIRSPSCSIAFSSMALIRRSSKLEVRAISAKSFTAFSRLAVSRARISWKRSSLGRRALMMPSNFFNQRLPALRTARGRDGRMTTL